MTADVEPTRIEVLLGQYPHDELERRQEAMRRAAPPLVELGFSYLDGSVYRPGLTNLHRALVAPVVARAAKAAERAGRHAVVPYGTLDLGVEEARHVVDIPVVGPGRTTANFATMLAERFVVICYDLPHVVMQQTLLRAWRVDGYVTSIRHVDIEITSMTDDSERLRERFVAIAKEAMEREGAQAVVPMGMTMVPVTMSATELSRELGVPVLDPLALSLHTAAALARTGVTNSRAAYPVADI
jgi:allantoin racemase